MEIDKLQLDLEILYMNNLLKQAKKNKIDQTPITDRIKELEYNIIDSISNTDTEKDIIYSDDYIYKKTWNKLNNVHKIIKIREFVNKLLINNLENKKKLKDDLITLVKTKKLTKKNSVNYDSINGRIVSIPILEYKNNQYCIKTNQSGLIIV